MGGIVDGAAGVSVRVWDGSGTVHADDIEVRNGASTGVSAEASAVVKLSNSSVHDNVGTGVSATTSAHVDIDDTTDVYNNKN